VLKDLLVDKETLTEQACEQMKEIEQLTSLVEDLRLRMRRLTVQDTLTTEEVSISEPEELKKNLERETEALVMKEHEVPT